MSGSIRIAGEDLVDLSEDEVRELRATQMSMVYQNPGGALNPTIRVGDQVAEGYTIGGASKEEAAERANEILRKVQISDPAGVMRRYPHQLSGGMQQRVIIAMALAKDPTLLILDEPTTGLDATVEAEVLDLVSALRQEFGTSVLFISHNLDVIAKMCDHVGVLYAGRLVEDGPVDQVFHQARHPYTVGLLRCLPRGGVRKDKQRLDTIPGFLPQLGADLPGVRVRRALRARPGHLQGEGAGLHRARPEPAQPLPLPRAGAVIAAGDTGHPRRPRGRRGRAAGRARRGRQQDLPPGGPRGPRGRRHLAGR